MKVAQHLTTNSWCFKCWHGSATFSKEAELPNPTDLEDIMCTEKSTGKTQHIWRAWSWISQMICCRSLPQRQVKHGKTSPPWPDKTSKQRNETQGNTRIPVSYLQGKQFSNKLGTLAGRHSFAQSWCDTTGSPSDEGKKQTRITHYSLTILTSPFHGLLIARHSQINNFLQCDRIFAW